MVTGAMVTAAAVHQFTRPAALTPLDGADLFAPLIVLTGLVAAGGVESWREDRMRYAAAVRAVTAVAATSAAWPGRVASWVPATPAAALSRMVVAGIVVMIVL